MRNNIKKLFILSSIFFSQNSFSVLDSAGRNTGSHTPLEREKSRPPTLVKRLQGLGGAVGRMMGFQSRIDKQVDEIIAQPNLGFKPIITSNEEPAYYAYLKGLPLDDTPIEADMDFQTYLRDIDDTRIKLSKLNQLKNEYRNTDESEKRKLNTVFEEYKTKLKKVFKKYEDTSGKLITKSQALYDYLSDNTIVKSKTYMQNPEIQQKFETTYEKVIKDAQAELNKIKNN